MYRIFYRVSFLKLFRVHIVWLHAELSNVIWYFWLFLWAFLVLYHFTVERVLIILHFEVHRPPASDSFSSMAIIDLVVVCPQGHSFSSITIQVMTKFSNYDIINYYYSAVFLGINWIIPRRNHTIIRRMQQRGSRLPHSSIHLSFDI